MGAQSDSAGIRSSFSARVVDTSVLARDHTLQKKRPRHPLSIATSLQTRLLRSGASPSPSLPRVLQAHPNTGKHSRNASKHKQVHGDAAPVFGKGHSQETQLQSAAKKLSANGTHGRRETSQMQELFCWPKVASESKANVGASLKLVLDLVCQRQMKAGQPRRNQQSHSMPRAYLGFLPCCTEFLTVT